jgi:hypothetical protein
VSPFVLSPGVLGMVRTAASVQHARLAFICLVGWYDRRSRVVMVVRLRVFTAGVVSRVKRVHCS